ncbi:MAG: hypothetical protein HOO91_06120 [Bacteroidales bacterium]|nr:hypothetical protein [Bacteroidales bacterium]
MKRHFISKLENEINLNSEFSEKKLLDFCHVSFGKYFNNLVKVGKLVPRECDIFKEKLLYFSYGVPYYKPRNMQTENALEFPIAFIFKIDAFKNIIDYFPFDTGCIYSSRISGLSGKGFEPPNDFCIHSNPEKLVSCFYKTNENYLKGIIRKDNIPKGIIIEKIITYLSANYSSQGIDNRQRTIECIYKDELNIKSNLLWLAFPDFLTKKASILWDKSDAFEYYSYPTETNENPAHLATHIAKKAKEIFKYKYQKP